MKYQNEITIKTYESKDNIINKLLNQGYTKKEEYTLKDIYLVPSNCTLNDNALDILKQALLIRNINDSIYCLTYKDKEYDNNGNITKQGKIEIKIDNIDNCLELLKKIGYKVLIYVNDDIEVYTKDNLDICIESVNDKYLYLEIEENEYYNLEGIKNIINTLNIDYDNKTYFAKKAQDIFEEQYK